MRRTAGRDRGRLKTPTANLARQVSPTIDGGLAINIDNTHWCTTDLGLGSHRDVVSIEAEKLDGFDQDMMEFVLNWAPYGGPPADEILPRFGLAPDKLRERIRLIVADRLARNPGCEERRLLADTLIAIGISMGQIDTTIFDGRPSEPSLSACLQ